MPTLAFDKSFVADLVKLDPPVQKKVLELPGKFEEAVHSGVHLEKLQAAADERVRTVRVDQFWRGVVVSLGEGRFALLRVMPHDKANSWATRQKFKVNPATGIVEIIDVQTVTEQVEKLTSGAPEKRPGLFDDVPDKAFRQLGIDEEVIPLLRRLKGEMELYAIASLLPKAQGDAVLLLADGKTADEAWAEIAADYAVTDEAVDPDDIDAALAHVGTQAEFIVTTSDEELGELLTGDFEAWRTFLHPTQRILAEKPVFNGPAKVTGGAGTGKTVVAMHRARFLARRLLEAEDDAGRILVATFTNSLARNLERTLKSFCRSDVFKRIHVSTVDSFAYQTLAGEGQKLRAISDHALAERAAEAAAMAALDEHGLDGSFLVNEWKHVVLARKITSLPEYGTTPRPGRGKPLPRSVRKVVWEAVRHLEDRLSRDRVAPYVQLADRAADVLAGRGTSPFRHVVVDEAQDLHPAQWRLLRAAVPSGPNDLFIVGDAHQRIYDSRVSLSSLDIETRGRSRRLKINYRTSQQILSWALGILTGEAIDDLDGEVESQVGYRSEFQGPFPVQRSFDTAIEEAQFVAGTVSQWLADGVAPGSIGIVGRTKDDTSLVRSGLDSEGIERRELGGDPVDGGVFVGTMHASKGLEFARLVVVGVSEGHLPLPLALADPSDDPQQYERDVLRERCLLYVACTRARDALVVTGVGKLSGLVPEDG